MRVGFFEFRTRCCASARKTSGRAIPPRPKAPMVKTSRRVQESQSRRGEPRMESIVVARRERRWARQAGSHSLPINYERCHSTIISDAVSQFFSRAAVSERGGTGPIAANSVYRFPDLSLVMLQRTGVKQDAFGSKAAYMRRELVIPSAAADGVKRTKPCV